VGYLTVRDIPSDLMAHFKAKAALERKTMKEAIVEAMKAYVGK
jgi:hypothetical protein